MFNDVRSPRIRLRGFSLVELMAVVAIVGILSTIGFAMFRRHADASNTTEAIAVVEAIRAAEEAYRAENQVYLNVSGTGGGVAPYPARWNQAGRKPFQKYAWVNPTHADYTNWMALNPVVTQPVLFGYVVGAGAPGAALPALFASAAAVTAVPTEPWYVIQAVADADLDGLTSVVTASSFNGEVYTENEGE